MRRDQRETQGRTPRRAVFRGKAAPRTDAERISALAAGADLPVEEVLREVADFRLALETDMIIAAAALDAATPDMVAEVLDGERAELATFQDRLLERLADAAATDELAPRRRNRAPRFQLVVAGAAAVLALLTVGRAVLPAARPAANTAALAAAQDRYDVFSTAVTSAQPGAVTQAADQLHQTLKTLITLHADDPAVARGAATLLQAEITLLESRDPAGASQVLAQARRLITLLQTAAPPKVKASVAPILDAVATPKASPKPSPSASPKPTPSPSASPSPKSSPTTNPLP